MDWRKKYTQLRNKYGKVYTNYLTYSPGEDPELYIEIEDGCATVVQKPDMNIMYFVASTADDFKKLVQKMPSNTVMNYAYKEKNQDEIEAWALEANLTKHATYMRTTFHYISNPYLEKEVPRRQILQKMYDPLCGEYPEIQDIPQMDSLWRELFDPLCDDVFSYKQWEEMVKKKEILVYREAGEIIAAYIFHYQGKKLYSNTSMNLGGANILYNMERRIFEEAWNKGIRIFYGWGNLANVRAHTHTLPEIVARKCADRIEHLYCDTFYKN